MKGKLKSRYSDAELLKLRALIYPEEDRHKHTTAKWREGFRHFRAANIICLEYYRRAPRDERTSSPMSKPAA
jgi:hypothetical protein